MYNINTITKEKCRSISIVLHTSGDHFRFSSRGFNTRERCVTFLSIHLHSLTNSALRIRLSKVRRSDRFLRFVLLSTSTSSWIFFAWSQHCSSLRPNRCCLLRYVAQKQQFHLRGRFDDNMTEDRIVGEYWYFTKVDRQNVKFNEYASINLAGHGKMSSTIYSSSPLVVFYSTLLYSTLLYAPLLLYSTRGDEEYVT